jgi:hypothetical protein
MAATALSPRPDHQSALIVFEERPSDSPFIERVWRSHSDRGGPFLSVAAGHFEMVVTRVAGKIFLTLQGPETKATVVHCPADGAWLGIRFKIGTFMPRVLPGSLRDHNDVNLPDASSRAFWLQGSAWPYPSFENAEIFVHRLAKAGIIARDSLVDRIVKRQLPAASVRSAQRHFLKATGVTHAAFRQMERARYTTRLLQEGVSAADAVHLAGYFDQAHLIRSLNRFIGQTPTKILRGETQLSFLYKTELPR